MKRLWLLPLILFMVLALFSEVVARDYSTAKSYSFQKKSRTQSFRDGDDQGLPSLFSASADDAVVGFLAKFSQIASGLNSSLIPNDSSRNFHFHALAYRYLFLPPPV
ncbi:hypothetical protein [Leptospira licerasiae]|uniref:Uncharacterized protein n=1 Tax=Leptospira licerasiae str. MMD4847 TaxID=1049971 RepID=A0ABN0HEJ8_9LEPT|nr:hypothetical protein [Leptospira licerasiae]EIE01006.1 hypothetical protein LEP1GSC185_3840 [Leptospira licerasiae serovar Varillal str. VAR 010]EJZ43902.1 hypothetical protein LEP1GSC178_2051 [Leptospira licerasiae str. MMD4847]